MAVSRSAGSECIKEDIGVPFSTIRFVVLDQTSETPLPRRSRGVRKKATKIIMALMMRRREVIFSFGLDETIAGRCSRSHKEKICRSRLFYPRQVHHLIQYNRLHDLYIQEIVQEERKKLTHQNIQAIHISWFYGLGLQCACTI